MLQIKGDFNNEKEDPLFYNLRRKECAVPVLQAMLTLFTVFYWLIGIVMVCGGLWAVVELHKYVDLPSEMSGTIPYLMICIGAFTLVVTSFAFSCVYRQHTLLIYIYAASLACIFVINMGLFVSMMCYHGALNKGLFDGLMRTIQNYNPDTTNLDFAQSKFQCCGATNYTDWIKSSPTKVIPTSCCVDPTNCVTANYGDVFTKGCYDLIKEYLLNNLITVGIATGVVGLIPLFGSRIAYTLAQYTAHGTMYSEAQYAAYFT